VHLGKSLNQCGNHKQTLRDAWVLMDIYSEDCRRDLRLSRCTQVVLATVPFSDRFYYSGSMKTRTWPVRSGFVPNGSLN